MSTRSETLIRSEFQRYDWDDKTYKSQIMPIGRFYRHCDGYPEGHGLHIALALAGMSLCGDDVNNRNWAQHFLKRLCAMDCDIEFEPPSIADGGFAHGDLEYVYRLTGSQDYTGGKVDSPDAADCVCIEVFAVSFSDALDGDYSQLDSMEPIYRGDWRGMLQWVCKRYPESMNPFGSPYEEDGWLCGNIGGEAWNSVCAIAHSE